MPDPLALAYSTTSYPYSTGYASIADVQARINAGTWDPTTPTSFPTVAQVNGWLTEATANIDVVLVTKGYYVPLQPLSGWVPGSIPTWNGIGLGAWLMLRSIAAAYAAHYVESSRHGSQGTHQDPNATHWMTVHNDWLTRLETGADNLAAFGAAGAFSPEIDPAHGADSGSYGVTLSDSARIQGSAFQRDMNLGSGWEWSSGSNPW